MTPVEWRRIEELYSEAKGLGASERAALLDKADPELRAEVEKLLAQPDSGSPLDRPAWDGFRSSGFSAPDVLTSGKRLGNFEIVALLGRGGMGEVYRARDLRLKREVAIKVLRPEQVGDDSRRRRLLQEARSASALNHPGIVTVHEIGEADGRDFIVMELVSGVPLTGLIGQRGLPADQAIDNGIAIARAVNVAHCHGILHRDLKPANIMVGPDRVVKVLDFGLAKLIREEHPASLETRSLYSDTEEGVIVGTVSYMSPEQAEGKPLDRRSDIFSLGVVLYEMLSGRRPFSGESRISTLAAILQRQPEPLREVNTEITPEVEAVVMRCLEKAPERRYQSMSDLQVALEGARHGRAVYQVGRGDARRLNRWFMAFPAVVLVAMIAYFAFDLIPSRTPAKRNPGVLTRVTRDGASSLGDISADGKLLAYNHYEPGKPVNIWVRQLAGGTPHQVTDESMGVNGFAFSPDGSRLAYTAVRDGRVYEIPALGGSPRLVGEGLVGGYTSDGSAITFSGKTPAGVSVSPSVSSVTPRGGTPKGLEMRSSVSMLEITGETTIRFGARELKPGLVIWSHALSPSGDRMLLTGSRLRNLEQDRDRWWTLSTQTGSLTAVEPPSVGGAQPAAWFRDPRDPTNEWIVYAAWSGDSYNIYRSGIRADGSIDRDGERLTLSTGSSYGPVVSANGILLFNSSADMSTLWSVPIDANAGRARGSPQRVLREEGLQNPNPAVSRDGSRLVYNRQDSIYVREMPSGREYVLADGFGSSMSPDGSTVVYQRNEGSRNTIYTKPAAGGSERVLLSRNTPLFGARGISSDNRYVLIQDWDSAASRDTITRIDLKTGEHRRVLSHGSKSVWHAYYSPDQRWMTFKLSIDNNRQQLFITPVENHMPAGEDSWIALTDGRWHDDRAMLSPDGNVLYFTSDRDGYACIWTQRLDPSSKRPLGSPRPLQHFHEARQFVLNDQALIYMDLLITRNYLVTSLLDRRTDIWMLDFR